MSGMLCYFSVYFLWVKLLPAATTNSHLKWKIKIYTLLPAFFFFFGINFLHSNRGLFGTKPCIQQPCSCHLFLVDFSSFCGFCSSDWFEDYQLGEALCITQGKHACLACSRPAFDTKHTHTHTHTCKRGSTHMHIHTYACLHTDTHRYSCACVSVHTHLQT